jgi:CAAX amino terminal protease family.
MENFKIFESNKSIFKGIACIVTLFFLGLTDILYLPLYIFNIKLSIGLSEAYNILTKFVAIVVVIYMFKNELETAFDKFKKNAANYLKKYIKYWYLAYGLMVLSNILISPFIRVAKNEQGVQAIIESSPVFAIFAIALFGPIIEELMFRFSLRKIIKNDWFYIIISGTLFGAMHIIGVAKIWQDWLFIIPYSIPGMVFAYVYVKSKNIFMPIMLHIIHNSFLTMLPILLMILNFFANL